MFPLTSDPLRRVASAPEDVLGGGGRLLHGGVDSHLHVPVQKCVWAVQTDHGHVGGRVGFCFILAYLFMILFLVLKIQTLCCLMVNFARTIQQT